MNRASLVDLTMAALIVLAYLAFALACLSPWISEAWRALR